METAGVRLGPTRGGEIPFAPAALDDAARGYEVFQKKEDNAVEVLLKP